MLDLNYVRENLSAIEEMLRHRGLDPAQVLGNFRAIDERRRSLITQAETLKAQRNRASEEIARLKRAGQDATVQIEQNKALREQGETLEKQASEAEQELRSVLAGIPNVPHSSVPIGTSSEENLEVRRWGTPPQFDFTPKPHWELDLDSFCNTTIRVEEESHRGWHSGKGYLANGGIKGGHYK
jgi:seryl-tRNA synthetase